MLLEYLLKQSLEILEPVINGQLRGAVDDHTHRKYAISDQTMVTVFLLQQRH